MNKGDMKKSKNQTKTNKLFWFLVKGGFFLRFLLILVFALVNHAEIIFWTSKTSIIPFDSPELLDLLFQYRL